MQAPLVSIALVTRNGIATLPDVLDAVSRQRVEFAYEVVAVDSGSTDGSAELLAGKVDRLFTIAPRTFNHGLTRNAAIEQARGELVVLLVQDAVPANDSWLDELTAPLLADARVAGTFARQRPRPDASPLTRLYLERAAVARNEPRTAAPLTSAAFAVLTPQDRLARCTFDNVCSCIRRSVWTQIPFRETPIGEDIEWAKEVLLAGHSLAFIPAAIVVHSHDRPAAYEFDRTCTLHRRLFELFELRTIPTLPLLVRAIVSSLVLHLRVQHVSIAAAARGMALAVVWPAGQYFGSRAARKEIGNVVDIKASIR
jgi:rhamnosyltransferase